MTSITVTAVQYLAAECDIVILSHYIISIVPHQENYSRPHTEWFSTEQNM